MLIPKHQYPRVLDKTSKGTLQRFDREIRSFLKKALHLPKDTPNAAFYARVRDEGLEVSRFSSLIIILRRGALERLSKGLDQRVARVAEALLQTPSLTAKELKDQMIKQHQEQLYASADGRGLRGTNLTPSTHDWVDDGTALLKGTTYISALKTRLGVVTTRLRASRGRPGAPVLCDLGCGRIESLGHILQSCPRLAPERTTRHNRVLGLLEKQLTGKGLRTLKEPTIRTPAGVRKPDLVIWDHYRSVVLDVQIVADSSAGDFLDRAHGLKRSYYDTESICQWVRGQTEHAPVVSTLTINWRGSTARQSYETLTSLGVAKGEIRLLTVRSLEGLVAALRAHRDIGGWG
ncbi:Retrovirus-related Pol polyprotein from type-1 retrotransposable element R2 [Portunus trituberculatus]|uniref:Retrovirus-related Pol polyprotein from type-1 retrotransposable element R2 n=1 Tax=Portunus trituberculatus TaxID=210409 RepID=A0A5B7JSU4_PORTR|nr:Retrovirus-related Pol polyprotein from type-1 retrotransposable element R2 [Portunus trituberculatus]